MKLDPPNSILKRLLASTNDPHNRELSAQLKEMGHLLTALAEEDSVVSKRNLYIAGIGLFIAFISLILGLLAFFRTDPRPEYIFPNPVVLPQTFFNLGGVENSRATQEEKAKEVSKSLKTISIAPTKPKITPNRVKSNSDGERDKSAQSKKPEEARKIEIWHWDSILKELPVF